MEEKKSLRRLLGFLSMKPGRICRSEWAVLTIFYVMSLVVIGFLFDDGLHISIPYLSGNVFFELFTTLIFAFLFFACLITIFMLVIRRINDVRLGRRDSFLLFVPVFWLLLLSAVSLNRDNRFGAVPKKMLPLHEKRLGFYFFTVFVFFVFSVVCIDKNVDDFYIERLKTDYSADYFSVRFPCVPSRAKNSPIKSCESKGVLYVSNYREGEYRYTLGSTRRRYLNFFNVRPRMLVTEFYGTPLVYSEILADRKHKQGSNIVREIVRLDKDDQKWNMFFGLLEGKQTIVCVATVVNPKLKLSPEAKKEEAAFMHSFKLKEGN